MTNNVATDITNGARGARAVDIVLNSAQDNLCRHTEISSGVSWSNYHNDSHMCREDSIVPKIFCTDHTGEESENRHALPIPVSSLVSHPRRRALIIQFVCSIKKNPGREGIKFVAKVRW